jgi:hypothetical protein
MSLSVDYVYQFALKLIRKNQSGGISSTEFAYQWNDAQATYMDDLLGRFQARNNGKEGPNTGLIENETIQTKLNPFSISTPLSISGGVCVKPDNFIYTLALRINGVKVFQVDRDEIGAMNDDVIDPPSISDNSYYYTEYGNQYKFFPPAVTAAELDYIVAPTDVFWAWTPDGQGRQVYDAANSTQPQWDNNSCREITKRMLTNIGVSLKDADFANFGKSVITTGE